MSEYIQEKLDKQGLYSGNVILELEPDVKGIKPKIKVNERATREDMDIALQNFSYLCEQVHLDMAKFGLPVTYLQPVKEKEDKKTKSKDVQEEVKTAI